MKRIFTRVCLLAAGMLTSAMAFAQMPMVPQVVPADTAVRVGVLPNGLTYYIRHNETPKGQADFYIAQKVGSALEEDHQRGLAHFLEHMCFNGTENFPGNQLIDWLASVGVKFGQNLNAYTGVDETVYNISNVPVTRTGVQDSCLLILHDWADGLLLDPEEIDKERGVIHEEWRRTNVGQMRIMEKLLPIVYPNEKYGERLPIGTMEVVDNFPPQALRDYYETWYRPDQQGIVVVGDIDPDYIEGKIKEIFSPIKMPENPKERVYAPVADTPGTIYAIGKDKEQQIGLVQMMFKTDPLLPREYNNTVAYYPMNFIIDMVSTMYGNRINELTQKPDSPIAGGFGHFGDYIVSDTKKAFTIGAAPKGDDIAPALETVYRELLRARDGGFTPGEYQRAKDEYLSRIERQYNDRKNRQTSAYVNEYVRNFIDNSPMPSMEDRYEMIKQIVPMIPLEAINSILPELIKEDNRVIMVIYPDNGEFADPTEEQLEAVIAKVDAETIEPYRDSMKEEPLIPALPAAGKIVSEKHLDQWDATELTLSNGVKVIVKPTTFKDDQILFNASAKGGYSVLPDEYAADIITAAELNDAQGLGDYTVIDLQKYLQGKQVSVGFNYGAYDREVSGSTTVKDLPTLMELLYATFTELNYAEEDFTSATSNMASILKNQMSNPAVRTQKNLYSALFKSPKRAMISPEIIEKANRENIVKLYREAMSNAADYSFVFVGSIDMDTFRPLVEQYIATLPADVAKATTEPKYDASLEIAAGSEPVTFQEEMETPQTYVFFALSANEPYTAKNSFMPNIIGQILSKRLIKTVREDMGAVYSIGASGYMGRQGLTNTALQSMFPMKPEMKKEVLDFIENEIKALTGNITDAELAEIKEFMVKEALENAELNGPWLNAITGYNTNGVDNFTNRVDVINSITVADLQDFLKSMIDQNNYKVVITEPKEK